MGNKRMNINLFGMSSYFHIRCVFWDELGTKIPAHLGLPVLLWPILLLAFPTGPGPGRTGGPGDLGNCSGGSCHFGQAVRGEGVAVYLPNGPYYRPGVPQRLVVHITGLSAEPETARFGFQLSPRLASAPASASGGTLRPLSNDVWTQCENARLPEAEGCPASAPLQFAQHRRPGGLPWWELEWTPPADARGPIEFYVAGNASNGLGDQAGDRIYLNSTTVEPAGEFTYRQPFGGGGASPNAWMEIYGSEIVPAGSALHVRVAGLPARVAYVGRGQMNALIPAEAPLGRQTLTVAMADGRTAEAPIWLTRTSLSVNPDLPVVAVGEMAVVQATGCGKGIEAERVDIRMNNRSYDGEISPSPGMPGLCQVQFLVPELVPDRYLFHVCVDGRCNEQRLELEVRRP